MSIQNSSRSFVIIIHANLHAAALRRLKFGRVSRCHIMLPPPDWYFITYSRAVGWAGRSSGFVKFIRVHLWACFIGSTDVVIILKPLLMTLAYSVII